MSAPKIPPFEYIVFQLIDWYKEAYGMEKNREFNQKNDLSILKVIKLSFFVVAKEHKSLLPIFNNYYAMPLGHVESDIYDHIRLNKGSFTAFTISPSGTVIKDEYLDSLSEDIFLDVDPDLRQSINTSIRGLKNSNPKLITYTGYQLVELSHQWYSWKRTIALAKSMGSKSRQIPSETIAEETKIFSLEEA